MATRMLQRRGTAAEWAAQNPILGVGEIGFETDTKVIKLGDGVTAWNDLTVPYLHKSGGTMTGALNLIAPTQDAHAVRKIDLDTRTAALGLRDILTYTANGTFVKANYPWLRAVRARAVGGGGGGGGTVATGAAGTSTAVALGRGGWSGGLSESVILATALSVSETVTVGAEGVGVDTGNTAGTPGGNSSFGTHVIAQGGPGGSSVSWNGQTLVVSPENSLASTGTGQVVSPCRPGSRPFLIDDAQSSARVAGNGGENPYGQAGQGERAANSGRSAVGYGAGGGGASATNNNAALKKGGDGAPGLVIVELYA